MTAIVFLHIPKTAGQTIHGELSRVVGPDKVSPIRVHTQAEPGEAQFPPGYALYSGHLDWDQMDHLPRDRFVFTVLRDPCERIASFYFYLLKEAMALPEEELQHPHRTGMRAILSGSADDYFFGGDAAWQRFIRDHYDNVYCTYLATRKMRGWAEVSGLREEERVDGALRNAALIDRVYSTRALDLLEADIRLCMGADISVVGKYVNAGAHTAAEPRWPKLLERLESDASIRRLEEFVCADERLMEALNLVG